MKFKVSPDFFAKVPDAYFGVVVVRGFDNTKSYPFIEQLLADSYQHALAEFQDQNVKEHPIILPYREAFRAIGFNPNKFKCSIEALMSRISKGGEIPQINSAVDLGNAVSLKYLLPIGVHDIARFHGNIEIRPAVAEDEFIPFGSDQVEHPDPGEIVYASGNEVKTRRWTWRQGENSKITTDSADLFIPIDGFTDTIATVKSAQAELANIFKEQFRLEPSIGFVDAEHPEFEF